MSFFGFDATLPRDRGHPTGAPGFTAVSNPFASFKENRQSGDDEDDGYVLATSFLQLAYLHLVS